MRIDLSLNAAALKRGAETVFELSAQKILNIQRHWNPARGTPVFTVRGRYSSRGWTEWTQGFQFGSAVLQFDATNDARFLRLARAKTVEFMASHVSHTGVHDHGFNNVSTYGGLLRLAVEGRFACPPAELDFYELALKVSGAVQAARWTSLPHGGGYIYSFNGPHSLFIDTMRSLRSLALAHRLGHVLMGEKDRRISLLGRLAAHGITTARYGVYYGEKRDAYDVRGRTAHESIFNINDGSYRCPSSQQGYSPFSTWTRGLAWALLGFAEQLEFLDTILDNELRDAAVSGGLIMIAEATRKTFLDAARATADFYIEHATCADGIPPWDTGAPNLHRLGDWASKNSNPNNQWEPVDSSAAAIAAQGLLRLGRWLMERGERKAGSRYRQAGFTIAKTLFDDPYLSRESAHQGILLHSIYHRPNGWDHVPPGAKVPHGESSMWGDYHARELALYLLREANSAPYLAFAAAAANADRRVNS